MNALLRKEIRLLLPPFAIALFLAIAPNLLSYDRTHTLALPGFCIGLLLLALSSFGREFISNTFAQLLSLPVPRWRLWAVKVTVLLVAMLVVALIWRISCFIRPEVVIPDETTSWRVSDFSMTAGLSVMLAFSGGLWTVLLLRQVAAAFWITLLIPIAILVLGTKWVETPSQAYLVFGLYSLGGVAASAWLFLRAQDTQWTGGIVSLPAWRRRRLSAGTNVRTRTGRPLAALVFKELQLQQTNFLVALALLMIQIGITFVRKVEHDEFGPTGHVLMNVSWLLWEVLPILVGCTSVAEERKLGTMEVNSCLPIGRPWQCSIKYGMAVCLGMLFGFVMPLLMEEFAAYYGLHRVLPSIANNKWVFIALLFCCGLTTIAFHISTLTRNLLQAFGAAVAMVVLVWGLMAAAMIPITMGWHYWSEPLIYFIGILVFWLAVVWLAFWNYRRVEVTWKIWLRNFIGLLAAVTVSSTAAAAIYNRSWELFQMLEPAHGPAQLIGSVRPKLLLCDGEMLALLPEGRLWTNQCYWTTNIEGYALQNYGSGAFAGTNTWVDLAASYTLAIGIQSDGSLWQLLSGKWVGTSKRDTHFVVGLKVERIGTNFDWKTVAVENGHVLGLKQGGTLWECSRTNGEFSTLVQVGQDSDWINVFANRGVRSAIKRDGSLWKWGNGMAGTWQHGRRKDFSTPAWGRMDNTNVVSFIQDYSLDLAVRTDGSMWASGLLPNHFWGDYRARNHAVFSPENKPVQVGKDTKWNDVFIGNGSVVALDQNGQLWAQKWQNINYSHSGPSRKLISSNHDWIAISCDRNEVLALASDGTISCWGNLSYNDYERLLAPSRKPIWNKNILAEAELNK